MSRYCSFTRFDQFVRRNRPSEPVRMGGRFVLVALAIAPAIAGCRTAYYTPANLPYQLHAQPVLTRTNINLEQLASTGFGTSQIGPGDLVEITIVSGSGEERAAPTPARVTGDGTVMVPLIGPIAIGGLEPVAAERQIAAAAIERGVYLQPYVTLTVTERAVNRVTVLGAVAKPGVVELPRGSCDLASALAAAGGMTKEASTRVEILQHDRALWLAGPMSNTNADGSAGVRLAAHVDLANPAWTPFPAPGPLDLEDFQDVTATQPMPSGKINIDLAEAISAGTEIRRLDDRDVVMVLPVEAPVIHVTGLVSKPNQFELPRGKDIRVLDAVAMAGGPSSPVADKVYVIRQSPDAPEPALIQVSMSKAKRNGTENIRLAPGDLVSVEQTPSTMTLDAVTRFFRVALGVSGRMSVF